MRRRELARYHDIAASKKVRGAGIGFAGVGIKIALLISTEVVTETRQRRHHVASTWRLASRQKAPWRWIPPPGLVANRGTAVQLRLENPLSPLLDRGFIEGGLRRNFQPLLDPALAEILRGHYPRGVTFMLNGDTLAPEGWRARETAPIAIRMARKRKPVGAGYLVRDGAPLATELRGVAVSTFGKVIKRGWDWLGLAPTSPESVGGIIEVPALAESLTLNKADFIRSGARGVVYLAYRKANQQAVADQLTRWGEGAAPDAQARRRLARPAERDLEAVLGELADEFPLLGTLVEVHRGGQRRLPVAGRGDTEAPVAVEVTDARGTTLSDNGDGSSGTPPAASPTGSGSAEAPPAQPPSAESPSPASPLSGASAPVPAPTLGLSARPRERRPARYGLGIQFEERPDDPELARLAESTVWVNEAHPAHRRAVASRSEGYHIALAVALALAPLAVDPAKEHTFITRFLARWGETLDRRKRR
jgi:hypothetical protein